MTQSLRERFEQNVSKSGPDECWLWLAYTNPKGYGQLYGEEGTVLAHRLAWVFENGEIPNGLFVMHSCDVPGCVNPKHLFIGTQQDNVDDMMEKGRGALGEKSSSAVLTEDDVLEIHRLYIPRIVTQQDLADKFGVGQDQISRIINSKRWKHVEVSDRPDAVLTDDDIREIRNTYVPFFVTYQDLADKFGVSKGSIQDILSRETWRNVA